MKYIAAVLFCSVFIFGCKPAAPADNGVTSDLGQNDTMLSPTPSVAQTTPVDTVKTAQKESNQASQKKQHTKSSQSCQVNFNVLAQPQQQTYFYYITGMDPAQFSCWIEIEKHGVEISQHKPCTIYYLDSPDVKINAASKNPIDADILMKHGVGSFVYEGQFWTLKGASQWKRKDGPYGYYNTNNHLGG